MTNNISESEEYHVGCPYAVTPSFIMEDDSICPNARFLYSTISMYCTKEGRCWASNKHFAEKHKVSTRAIQYWLQQLSDAGYIFIELEKEGLKTKRNIWIDERFKKIYMKRTKLRARPNNIMDEHEENFVVDHEENFAPITTSNKVYIYNNNNKGAAAPDPAVVVFSEEKEEQPKPEEKPKILTKPKAKKKVDSDLPKKISPHLEKIEDLTEDDKIFISKYPEERILLALQFAKIEKPTGCLAQQLKWHCKQNKPPIPNLKKKLRAKCEELKENYESETSEIYVSEHDVIFTHMGQGSPIEIKFSEEDAERKINEQMRIRKYMKKKRPRS